MNYCYEEVFFLYFQIKLNQNFTRKKSNRNISNTIYSAAGATKQGAMPSFGALCCATWGKDN
jgi:hypothetical protein